MIAYSLVSRFLSQDREEHWSFLHEQHQVGTIHERYAALRRSGVPFEHAQEFCVLKGEVVCLTLECLRKWNRNVL